jgi:hypothetical protein
MLILDDLELMKDRVDEILSESPSFIEMLYGCDCFTYESPDIFGDTALKTFEDDYLRQTPVTQLRMLIG